MQSTRAFFGVWETAPKVLFLSIYCIDAQLNSNKIALFRRFIAFDEQKQNISSTLFHISHNSTCTG
jgi:hypothetical protein